MEFIKVTENKHLKLYLEKHSQDYLRDLLLIFKVLNEENAKHRFPIMEQYLKPLIEVLDEGDKLDSKVRDILDVK